MKLSAAIVALSAAKAAAFVVNPAVSRNRSPSSLYAEGDDFAPLIAEIRGPTEKNEVLEFGWDGAFACAAPCFMLYNMKSFGCVVHSF